MTLIGANGAGKSSTLRTIAGLVKPSAGKISFLDEDITGMDSSLIVSKGITLVPEGRRIFQQMTVQENLEMGAFISKDKAKDQNNLKKVFELVKEYLAEDGVFIFDLNTVHKYRDLMGECTISCLLYTSPSPRD